MSRLCIEISPEKQQKINEQTAIEELEELLLSRIKQAKDSPVSSNTFQQITDSVLRTDKS